ncbi:MAG: hypothetical protein WB870_17000, partial [Gallionellaceae bacterium]
MNDKRIKDAHTQHSIYFLEKKMEPRTFDSRTGKTAARAMKSMLVAKGDPLDAAAYAAGQRWQDTPDVERIIKAPIAGLGVSTSNSSALAPMMGIDVSDMLPVLRPKEIIGQLSTYRVPF